MEQDYYIALDGVTIGYRTTSGVFIRVCKAERQDIAKKILTCIREAGCTIHTHPLS